MKFCSDCGHPLQFAVPPGDDRRRFLCPACGAIHYQNPRVVAGCIPEVDGRILLCRRAIEPCYGRWTLPAGYLENGETVTACAERETLEETGASVERLVPYLLFNICHINQIYFMFRGRVVHVSDQPGKESLEVKLFAEAEVPWEQIAFRVITATLKRYFGDGRAGAFPFSLDDIGPSPDIIPARSR